MIGPTPEQEKARQQAGEDLLDIAHLRQNEAFNRYWLRRLKSKRDTAHQSFCYDDLTPEKREVQRQLMLAMEELLKMMGQDETSARAVMEGA